MCVIVAVVLCGCETWSLIVEEEHRLRVAKNRVVRRRAYRVLVGKPECERALRRSKHRWEDNTKMDIKKMG